MSSHSQAQLQSIGSIDGDTARQILYFLCSQNDEILQTTTRLMAGTQDAQQQVCIQCEKPFDPASNNHEACVWHSGDLEPDFDNEVWDEHDDNTHGPIEASPDLLADFPEAFIWGCCEKPNGEPGCERDIHRTSLEDEAQNQGPSTA